MAEKTTWEKVSTTETPMQHKNGLNTSLLFFLKIPKIWVGRKTLNGEKTNISVFIVFSDLMHIAWFLVSV